MNVWRVEVARRGAHGGRAYRHLVRLEDRPRTREQAVAAALATGPVLVKDVTQRCVATTRLGTRCRKFTGAPNARCQQHGGDHVRED